MKNHKAQGISKGLYDADVERSAREHGRNVFSNRKPKSFLRCFLENLGEPFGSYYASIFPEHFGSDGFFISKFRKVR